MRKECGGDNTSRPVFRLALALGFSLFLSLAGCAEDTRPCKLGLATTLPFRVARGHIYVDVVINGKTSNFMFDTGDEFTMLTTDAVRRLGLTSEDLFGYAEGIGGARQVGRTMTHRVQLGSLKGGDFPLLVADMKMEPTSPPADGILGMDFLALYDIDLDWATRRISLFRKLQGCTKPGAALAQPLYAVPMLPSEFNHPAIRLFRRAARRLGLTKTALAADPHAHIQGVGPRAVEEASHVFGSVGIGDLTLKNTKIAVVDQPLGDVDVLVGLAFMTKVHVWISNSSHTLILQYPPLPSPKL
jgi:predicted aspartyl protease